MPVTPTTLLRCAFTALLMWAACCLPCWALDAVEVAPGVYAFLGENAEPAPANSGFVGNSGFIVGDDRVLVIDTGGSRRHGEAMLEAIARVTSKPVHAVVITHAVQDFVFGAAAFNARGIALMAHRKTVDLMRARCEHCLELLRRTLGEEPLRGSSLVLPQHIIDTDTTVRLGGRAVDLIHPGWASTPGDLMVLDRRTRTLFTGGVVTSLRVPELRDGDFGGWLRTLAALPGLSPALLVPGYGPPCTPRAAHDMIDYLHALDARMRALYAQGAGLTEALDAADVPAFQGWALYPEQHRRNALRHYLQLEVEDLERD